MKIIGIDIAIFIPIPYAIEALFVKPVSDFEQLVVVFELPALDEETTK